MATNLLVCTEHPLGLPGSRARRSGERSAFADRLHYYFFFTMQLKVAKYDRASENRFFMAVSVALALIVFVGFAPTYFLKDLFGGPPLSLLLHIHGAVMTLWYALFIVQVRLAATRNVALHRKLGIAGLFVAALVAGLSTADSIGLAKQRLTVNPNSVLGPFLLGIQLFSIVLVFVALVSAAVYFCRRTDYHKRLMTMAMLTVLGPAIVRLPFIDDNIPPAIAVSVTLILVCIAVDTARTRRLHPAFGWGAMLVIGILFAVAPLCQTPMWIQFVRRMLQ